MGTQSGAIGRRQRFAIGLVTVFVAAATAGVVLLVSREPITSATIQIDPETGRTVSSQMFGGYVYPSTARVVMIAMLAGGLVVACSLACVGGALFGTANRRVCPDRQYGPVAGDSLGLLDEAPVEFLD